MKSSVVALFSVNLMYSVDHMSVKVMLHCINKISKNVYFLNRLAETSALVSRVEKIDIYPEGIDTYLDFSGFKAILVFSPEILAIC